METKPKKLLDQFIPDAIGNQFVIPIYQRNYTWTIKGQLEPLIKDLINLIKDEKNYSQHFLGTLVYLENKVNGVIEKSVVDGQQRLVTMFLIAHAMKAISDSEYRALDIDERYLQNYNQPVGTRYRQRLYPAVANGDDYLKIAEGNYPTPDTAPASNINDNFIFLRDQLQQLVNQYSFDHVFHALRRFSVVCIKLDDNDNAQQIFESINSTGERLTAADLIRNFIMMDKSNEEQTQLYLQYWSQLEDIFEDSKSIEAFFRYYLGTVTEQYANKHLLYEAFKVYWYEATQTINEQQLLQKIIRFAQYFDKLYYQTPTGQYADVIYDLQNIGTRATAPLLLGLSEWYYNGKLITQAQYFDVIHVLNTYQIRRYFNGDDINQLLQTFPALINNVKYNVNKYGFENIVDIVIYYLITKNQANNRTMPTDKIFKLGLVHKNLYDMKLTRWLLEKIENQDNELILDMSKLSIEHIMPQAITPYWQEQAGVEGEEYTQLINTLGNLTLVTKVDNSHAGNKDFASKKAIFADTLHIKLNKQLYELKSWTASSIARRSGELSNIIIDMYPYLHSMRKYDDYDEHKR